MNGPKFSLTPSYDTTQYHKSDNETQNVKPDEDKPMTNIFLT